MCMWRQGVNDDFDWSRFNNSEFKSYAGPISDHSKGSPMGKHEVSCLKAYLHYFGQEGLDLHEWSLTCGYLIESALN